MSGQPKYLLVADTLRKEIAKGLFRDGQTLMTEEELRLRFDVSRQTIRQAIALLEDDGLVDRRRGSGTYVRHGPRHRQGTVQVGVVATYITDYIFPSILQGIESELNKAGAVMSLSATYNDRNTERDILERMLDGGVDGLIFEGNRTAKDSPNADLFHRFRERNIPVLFMNGTYPGMNDIPHLQMDDYAGGKTAAEIALDRGYRRLAGVFKTDDVQGQERLAGFTDELHARGFDVPPERLLRFGTEERMGLFRHGDGAEFVNMLLKREADCVVCYNDVFATSLMDMLKNLGVRLPEEIGFIGFDNATFSEMIQPRLTTLAHPKEEFGVLAAEKILRMISGDREKSVNLPWNLVERNSLPPVKAG